MAHKGRVFHLMEPDMHRELYGVPQFLSALQSAWVNEAATWFRRKYYKNGSHAGFMFYMTINEWAGLEVVRFAPYNLATGGEGAK